MRTNDDEFYIFGLISMKAKIELFNAEVLEKEIILKNNF